MKIENVHERTYPVEASALAPFLDGLGSGADRLWPRRQWPPMVVGAGLHVGSAGGHGPVRYVVERYEPGRSVSFRFRRPRGWDGTHSFVIQPLSDGRSRLIHVLEMRASGAALLQWLLVFRPLHDAVIEEGLDRVATAFGAPLEAPPWSARVRFLRWALTHASVEKVHIRRR